MSKKATLLTFGFLLSFAAGYVPFYYQHLKSTSSADFLIPEAQEGKRNNASATPAAVIVPVSDVAEEKPPQMTVHAQFPERLDVNSESVNNESVDNDSDRRLAEAYVMMEEHRDKYIQHQTGQIERMMLMMEKSKTAEIESSK